jgi:hypothetical protein
VAYPRSCLRVTAPWSVPFSRIYGTGLVALCERAAPDGADIFFARRPQQGRPFNPPRSVTCNQGSLLRVMYPRAGALTPQALAMVGPVRVNGIDIRPRRLSPWRGGADPFG